MNGGVDQAMKAAISAGASTDVGAVRDVNEDAVLAEYPLFAVADGMGGHAAGEVASALAIERLRPLLHGPIQQESLHEAINAANQAILDRVVSQPETTGMGTTLSGIALGAVGGLPHWFVFNIGDSRVYRLVHGALSQVTTDHSEMAELLSAGRITADEVRTHPRRNVVTRSLGTHPGPVVDFWVRPAQAGETYLVSSDGLTLELSDDQIAEVLNRGLTAQDTADLLVSLTVEAGGRDNVSVVVVSLGVGATESNLDVATAPRRYLLTGDV